MRTTHRSRPGARLSWLAALSLATAAAPAYGGIVVFEHLPEANSTFISHHSVGGPVLADDFDPIMSGGVVRAEWWGSLSTSTSWELTLHTGTLNAGVGEPAVNPASTGGIKYFVTAAGTDPDGDGIYYYSTPLPGDFLVTQGPLPAGSEFWFSIANFDDAWTWAFAGAGPTVGDEHWYAVQSTGALCGDGGPHCGPWVELPGRDFAFRLEAVPEPATFLLVGLGGILLGLRRRR
ncbi:MAG: PEP-CTERM sorting domain-containing protein [Bryobacteraceae bacterium]